jgi:hypothetical protein
LLETIHQFFTFSVKSSFLEEKRRWDAVAQDRKRMRLEGRCPSAWFVDLLVSMGNSGVWHVIVTNPE